METDCKTDDGSEGCRTVDLKYENIETETVPEVSMLSCVKDEPLISKHDKTYLRGYVAHISSDSLEYQEPTFTSTFTATFNNSVTFEFRIERKFLV